MCGSLVVSVSHSWMSPHCLSTGASQYSILHARFFFFFFCSANINDQHISPSSSSSPALKWKCQMHLFRYIQFELRRTQSICECIATRQLQQSNEILFGLFVDFVCVFSFARFVIHYDIFSCEFFLFHSLRAASASNANICSFRLSTRFFMILLILRKHTQFMMVWFRFYGLFAFALFPSTAQPFRTIGFCWFSIFVWKLFSQIIEARNWKMNKEIIGKQTRLKWCKWNGKQRNFELVWYESVE